MSTEISVDTRSIDRISKYWPEFWHTDRCYWNIGLWLKYRPMIEYRPMFKYRPSIDILTGYRNIDRVLTYWPSIEISTKYWHIDRVLTYWPNTEISTEYWHIDQLSKYRPMTDFFFQWFSWYFRIQSKLLRKLTDSYMQRMTDYLLRFFKYDIAIMYIFVDDPWLFRRLSVCCLQPTVL